MLKLRARDELPPGPVSAASRGSEAAKPASQAPVPSVQPSLMTMISSSGSGPTEAIGVG